MFPFLSTHRREARNLAWLENIAQDFSHSFRALQRNPGFTAVSVLILALGIGATTALFSVLDAALLHPLSAREPDRLVWLQEFSKGRDDSGSNPARLADWQAARSFTAAAGFYSEGAVWLSPNGPLQLQVLRTVGNMSGVLAVKLQLGRGFTAAEIRGEGQPVALLTAAAFSRRFQANPAVVHQTLRLAGTAYQVVGVLSPEVDYPEEMDVWAPAPREIQKTSRAAGFLGIVARLAPGVSVTRAQAEIDVLSAHLAAQYPATDRDRSASLTPLVDHVAEGVRKPLLVLFGAVASVLAIGCLNIAGLLLARGLARRREAAIRVSVGAGYARLVRLFFAESLLLAGAGGVLGLLLAFQGVALLKFVLPPEVPHLAAVSVNVRVALCGLGLSVLAALVFGALPAWQFAAGAQSVALKNGGGSVGVRKSGLRAFLVIAEVAFSVVLLVTAALLAGSFLKMRSKPAGFNSAHAYAFTLELPWDTDMSVLNSTAADTLLRLNAFPGTISSGVVDRLPLHGGAQSNRFLVRGQTFAPSLAEKEFGFRTASPGFFAAAGIPVMAGSLYRDWQGIKGAREALISQRLAGILFPGQDPVGHEIAPAGPARDLHWFRIVGVVGSVAALPADSEPAAEIFVPWGATYWPLMNFVIRTERPLADISRYVHDQIQNANSSQIFSPVATLDERTAETRSAPRTAAFLVGGFAVVALALAALGIFGLMSHETTRRTQEIGVRLALGADRNRIAADALMRGIKLAATGLAVGLAGAWYTSRLLESLLFGIEPHDALPYVVAAAMLLATALFASLLPAWRAARIDPIQALRHN
jgi:putative ABC transport system permease protein